MIAIGWDAVGSAEGRSRAELLSAVRGIYGSKGAPGVAGMLFRFANDMRIEDLVITPDSETRELHIGRISGDYEFRPIPVIPRYPHTRRVVWTRSFSRDELPKRLLYQLGSLLTVSTPTAQDQLRAYLLDKPTGVASDDESTEIAAGIEAEPLYDELRAQTTELIRAQVAALDAYETQDLVAGILRALGYHTRTSPEGADGGIDVLASRDALGLEPPLVKVQVKARPTTHSKPEEVRALAGLVAAPEERGVFVSTGGFTREAENDARVARITLIGMDRLTELLVENYERLDQDTRSLVPLRRVWVP
ncbi:MAG TPA: restriction endonuclease [Solirubrobacteraceae bacterium]|nr:restriction endonuclease [Solirubrobacteraceae bacterium]